MDEADFLGRQPTIDSYWRAVILFGQNVASYKFALAKSLIELSAEGESFVTLEKLAIPFSKHLVEHLLTVTNWLMSWSIS
jgi:hypothetical protein